MGENGKEKQLEITGGLCTNMASTHLQMGGNGKEDPLSNLPSCKVQFGASRTCVNYLLRDNN
jgi:hypothetical protein